MNNKNNMVTDAENQWIAYLNGEPDVQDYLDLDEKEKADLTAVWEMTGTNFSYAAADPEKGWSNLQIKIESSNTNRSIKLFKSRIFKYAAMIIMFLGIGFATYQLIRRPKIVEDLPIRMAMAETNAHPVSFTLINLPDGSTAKLNANTKIEYPERFASGVRKVRLSGEAFFEVTKDSTRPFRIETTNASVEVLGTSFNVSAYPNADRVEVNVETGKVKLIPNTVGGPYIKFAVLPAGERGWLKVSSGEIGKAETLAPNYAAWLTKMISFQRTPLSEVFAVLENTYHVKFKLENSEIGKISYTANFGDMNLDYIVKVIAHTHHLRVKNNGDEIILTKRAD